MVEMLGIGEHPPTVELEATGYGVLVLRRGGSSRGTAGAEEPGRRERVPGGDGAERPGRRRGWYVKSDAGHRNMPPVTMQIRCRGITATSQASRARDPINHRKCQSQSSRLRRTPSRRAMRRSVTFPAKRGQPTTQQEMTHDRLERLPSG